MSKLADAFSDAHIFRMTDDTGIFQHTKYDVPDLGKGYTTDDNARALIMAVMLYEKNQKPEYLDLVYRYLAFILHAQNDDGHFRNFMTYDRLFTETQGSEECFGRCLWALGYAQVSPVVPVGVKDACISTARRALPQVLGLKCLRGQAYALIGLGLINLPESGGLICTLADAIAACYDQCAGEDWRWYEDSITYDNALLPWAMFAAHQKTGQERFLAIAGQSMEFLDQGVFRDGFFRPVGCNGWQLRGSEPALYDEQPVEASMSTLAHLAAYEVTGDGAMLDAARRSLAWYTGDNSCQQSMIDPETGGCYDGIMAGGMNRNQGAESIVGYAIASLSLSKVEALASKNMHSRNAARAGCLIHESHESAPVHRPWGVYTILGSGPKYKMKKIVVNPGQILSLQMHYHRSEHWIVVSGTAKVTVGEKESMIHENEWIFVPQTAKHRIENAGKMPLEIIEVQNGSYLGEDDIVRFEDKYGRAGNSASRKKKSAMLCRSKEARNGIKKEHFHLQYN